ncbi:hypothetical protein FH972_010409 [Carpinus fangiana]|uniref:Uncharacterized protein n=1 Tax=Carpinus fangiana TaxID=176857 RepID=A0A660KPX6_9ROSI|nr:hypothetical protein FH972_010409 [Carpinus fangiana]
MKMMKLRLKTLLQGVQREVSLPSYELYAFHKTLPPAREQQVRNNNELAGTQRTHLTKPRLHFSSAACMMATNPHKLHSGSAALLASLCHCLAATSPCRSPRQRDPCLAKVDPAASANQHPLGNPALPREPTTPRTFCLTNDAPVSPAVSTLRSIQSSPARYFHTASLQLFQRVASFANTPLAASAQKWESSHDVRSF